MKLLFILLALGSFCFKAPSNGASQKGNVTTATGTLAGELTLNLEKSTILLKIGDTYKLLNAKQIASASLPDLTLMGVAYEGDHYLFEVLYSEQTTLLYRENLSPKYSEETNLLPYFLLIDGEAVRLHKEKELMEIFGNDQKWMAVYQKSANLSLDDPADVKSLFAYYKEQKGL